MQPEAQAHATAFRVFSDGKGASEICSAAESREGPRGALGAKGVLPLPHGLRAVSVGAASDERLVRAIRS